MNKRQFIKSSILGTFAVLTAPLISLSQEKTTTDRFFEQIQNDFKNNKKIFYSLTEQRNQDVVWVHFCYNWEEFEGQLKYLCLIHFKDSDKLKDSKSRFIRIFKSGLIKIEKQESTIEVDNIGYKRISKCHNWVKNYTCEYGIYI